jgi:hypothetical protein
MSSLVGNGSVSRTDRLQTNRMRWTARSLTLPRGKFGNQTITFLEMVPRFGSRLCDHAVDVRLREVQESSGRAKADELEFADRQVRLLANYFAAQLGIVRPAPEYRSTTIF